MKIQLSLRTSLKPFDTPQELASALAPLLPTPTPAELHITAHQDGTISLSYTLEPSGNAEAAAMLYDILYKLMPMSKRTLTQ